MGTILNILIIEHDNNYSKRNGQKKTGEKVSSQKIAALTAVVPKEVH